MYTSKSSPIFFDDRLWEGKEEKMKWLELKQASHHHLLLLLLVVEIDETRASRSSSSSVKVSLWWLLCLFQDPSHACSKPHFLWDTENAIEKALNAFSSTFVTICHPDRLGRRIFYVMQSRLISALRLIFSTLFHFKRPGCSLFYTRWKRLSLWKMMKGFSSMSTNQQQAAAAATNETTWGMPGENWRHILCLI